MVQSVHEACDWGPARLWVLTVGRPLAPCGTPAAYRRHLREGSEPCTACRKAKADEKAGRESSSTHVVEVVPDSPVEFSLRDDLVRMRTTLIEALKVADVPLVPRLTSELLKIVKALADLDAPAPQAEGAVVVDEFTAAREARAVRKAGA